ncbi:RING finger protein B [Drosophila nasuta]|uniref:RING finger protein B n=1 Tax=Drosophila nasuta TaxID=42062 RepID=UPI00295E34D8|nr:RING finger protein B [Drosophila nasuta]XP_060660022.1 RING finger protein B [Drosophila nasuta]
MPICKSSPAMASSKKTATDISADHVTEAAQVKRTREQAYFNSYDFDAIEVLPYDEDDDETVPHSRSSSGRYSGANGSHNSHSNSHSNSNSNSHSNSHSNSNAAAITKFAYLQRLGAFFGHKSATDGTSAASPATGEEQLGTVTTANETAAAGQSNDNFLLPRAMLKYQYQSVGGHVVTSMPLTASLSMIHANSSTGLECQTGTSMARAKAAANEMPVASAAAAAATTTATAMATAQTRNKKRSIASNASSTHTTDSGLGNTSNNNSNNNNSTSAAAATTQAATTAAAAVAAAATSATRAGSGSHYSTDKSGSSGYYSSHVCSTYSLDEHIYCEPVIDILEASDKMVAAKQRPALQLPTKVTTISQHLAMQDAATTAVQSLATADSTTGNGTIANSSHQEQQQHKHQHQQHQQQQQQQLLPHYSDKLRILETSIENLDRHLKTFPCLYAQQHIVSFMQQDANSKERASSAAATTLDIGEKLRAYNQLPTIIEGYDTQRQQQQQQQMEPIDDSLLDIDLDAFLLQPKQQQQQQQQQQQHQQQQQMRQQLFAGIDNPSFLSDEQLEENNYKCAKYINSCPEDAYRLDTESTANASYAKRYEDQLHFQNTRELLEDVRDKIRLLQPTPTTDIPQELEGMIQTLKDELESYLQRMNQHSELELRQLCSGLGRQQHVLRLQNAFERRRSYAGDVQLNAYESVRDGVLISANGRPLSVREQIMTIRCASDPNFKMKRKSISEVFPVAECYVESAEPSCSVTPTLTQTTTPTPTTTPSGTPSPPLELKTTTTMVTQMQRNLNFHKPVLAAESSTSRLGNGGGGGGSGNDKVDSIAEWHRKKPSIWEMYYGTNRLHQSLLGKQRHGNELVISSAHPTLSYPSSRPESDFTLDLPRAEQLRLKMEKEKKFRQRCRFITTFLSLVFFLLTVMVVSLVLTRGKRMFGSMI